jgi:hypothetical protein
MDEYHKINSVYKRDERGKFILGDFAEPEFDYLKDNDWLWTEKIDGTNIRVLWEPNVGINPTIRFGGKTDNAQIPTKLLRTLQDTFTPSKFFGACLEDSLCLYGEGYGAGIQKGGGNYSLAQKFILFDVKIGDWWLRRHDVEDIAKKLSIDVVPVVHGTVSLARMIEIVSQEEQQKSYLSGDALAEGYVGTPLVPLFNRKQERIITKIKYRDFAVKVKEAETATR